MNNKDIKLMEESYKQIIRLIEQGTLSTDNDLNDEPINNRPITLENFKSCMNTIADKAMRIADVDCGRVWIAIEEVLYKHKKELMDKIPVIHE